MTNEKADAQEAWSFLRSPDAVAKELLRDTDAAEAAAERIRAAKHRAEDLGIDFEGLLAADEERIAHGDLFPSPICLRPAEVERYWTDGGLSASRRTHVESCPFCQRVLRAAQPTAEQLERFLDELGSLAARASLERRSTAVAGR